MEGLWLKVFNWSLDFEGHINFLEIYMDCVPSMGVIALDFGIFKIFPLSTVTWKFPTRKARFALGFQGSSWWVIDMKP